MDPKKPSAPGAGHRQRVSRRPPPATSKSKPGDDVAFGGSSFETRVDAAALDSAPGSGSKDIPAAAFAALVGRSLRTLRNWDKASLTHPEMRNSRRYYGAADVAAVLSSGKGRKGPRKDSIINYIAADWDNGT